MGTKQIHFTWDEMTAEALQNRPVKIYGLIDPETQELRYVGKTVQTLGARLSQHIAHRVRQRTKCSSWIRGLQKRALQPEMFLIEECDEKDWRENEEFWVSYFQYVGARLCNLQQGGRGPTGTRMSEESKRKIGAASKGRKLSLESRQKLSASKRAAGIKRPDLSERNIKNARLTAQQIERIRDLTVKGRDLAREFGISPTTVCNIRKGLIYSRVVSSSLN